MTYTLLIIESLVIGNYLELACLPQAGNLVIGVQDAVRGVRG